jgi:hypothetical protein
MVGNKQTEVVPKVTAQRVPFFVVLCALFLLLPPAARAALQFDAFLGYDGQVPEANWFPLVCEIKNDGAAFPAIIEITDPGSGVVRVPVELPTGTLKRVVIPLFSGGRSMNTWNARLLDDRGRERAEQGNLRSRRQLMGGVMMIGALPRTVSGVPVIRTIQQQEQRDLQPIVARIQSPLFPDSPIVLGGLDALYLDSEKAPELKSTQVNALLDWLNAGGHLIVPVEQIADVMATPWLRAIFPVELREMQSVARHPELQAWLQSATWNTNVSYAHPTMPPPTARRNRNQPAPAEQETSANLAQPFPTLPADPVFEGAPLEVAAGKLRDGKVVVSADGMPLIVTAQRGRGRVTALLFSPEREPFHSWKNLPTFWAKLTDVPGGWYMANDFALPGGMSSDGIFGAMIDSRQVHKLPVGWLLLLLIVYLVIIGPLDQYWLKRIGKPMLTWITFPCYVVLFSLLIYFIGYKLRAGESELNELHIVDILPRGGEQAELKGQTYASVYSPANEKYAVGSPQRFATIRGEFAGLYSGNVQSEKLSVLVDGDTFRAEVFVPVWTSQLLVSDWWQGTNQPLSAAVEPKDNGWAVTVENRTPAAIGSSRILIDGVMMTLGPVGANASKTFQVSREQGTPLNVFVGGYSGAFQQAVSSRSRTFGGGETWRIDDLPNGTAAASFLSQMNLGPQGPFRSFTQPAGLDLSPVAERGNAVLLAWAADYAPVKSLYQFVPRRNHRNTLWRLAVPVKPHTSS